MSTPRVSVVIPARDTAATLPAVLAALMPQARARGDTEVLVVDNGSIDQTPEIARAAGAQVIEQARPGAAAARNLGWSKASGELVAFLDSDCIPRDGWLDALVEGIEANPAAGAVGGRVLGTGEGNLLQRHAARAGYYFSQELSLANSYMPYVLIGCSCYRRSVLGELDGLDEGLRSGEDADLTWRMQLRLRLYPVFVPEAVVDHVHRSTLVGLWRQWSRYGYGAVQLEQRYPDRPRPTSRPDRLLSRLGRELAHSVTQLGRLLLGRADHIDVLAPLLRCFEVAAMRSGRLKARRDGR